MVKIQYIILLILIPLCVVASKMHVNGKTYYVSPTTHLIAEVTPSVLHLDASVEAPKSIYPGQRFKLVYRISYRGNIRLTTENLPFLTAEGFQKLGSVRIEESIDGELNVQKIVQEVQALAPGTFLFPAALIEGEVHDNDVTTQHETLRAEASQVVVTVLPFPIQQQPPTFTGAMGEYTIASSLNSSSNILLGDHFDLKITLAGNGNLDALTLPDLSCQPGFSGFFILSGMPGVGVVEGKSKSFSVTLAPTTVAIKQIPAIAFTFFNAEKAVYHTVTSAPIAIQVKPLPLTTEDLPQPNQTPKHDWKRDLATADSLPLQAPTVLHAEDFVVSYIFEKMAVVITLVLIMLLVLSTVFIFLYEAYKKRYPQSKSVQLLEEAKSASDPLESIEKALLLALYEAKVTQELVLLPDRLPTQGIAGEVRAFLMQLHMKRFGSTQTDIEVNQELSTAKQLLYRILEEGEE